MDSKELIKILKENAEKNPYYCIGMGKYNENLDSEEREAFSEYSSKIRAKYKQMVDLAVNSKYPAEDIIEILSLLDNIYKQIETPEKRKKLELRKKYDRGELIDDGYASKIETRYLPSKKRESGVAFETKEKKYIIVPCGVLMFKHTGAVYDKIGKHKVFILDATNEPDIEADIFTNLNINMMKENEAYREKILDDVLSPESIKIAQKENDGYVGSVEENNKGEYKTVFSKETINAVHAYLLREKEKDIETDKIIKEYRNEDKDER